jgi:putative DNA primase/helicase
MTRLAKETALGIYSEVAAGRDDAERHAIVRHANRSRNARPLAAMLKVAESEAPIMADVLDADPMLLNVANGTLDLRTGALNPHDRAQMLTMMSATEYDPSAECPTFEAFLGRILPDPALRSFLQRAVGYSLTGDVSAQCLFLLYGSGANGKSTLLDVLAEMMGEYSWRAGSELLLMKRGNANKEGVANLHRRRFVATVEVESGSRLAESLTKELTGGDTINARRLYQHEFTFRPTHKIWLAANHQPAVRGTDHAIWRRIHVLPFTVSIPDQERDTDLPDKLRSELPGILRWAVEGCTTWLAAGKRLAPPAAVAEQTQKYMEEQDTIGTFMAERCQQGLGYEANATRLYAAYVAWCEEGREGTPVKQTAFGREMESRGHGKRVTGGRTFRQGLRFRIQLPADDDTQGEKACSVAVGDS